MVEGYGYRGDGGVGDPNGSLDHVRQAMDQGAYRHVGELSMANLEGIDAEQFTLVKIQQANETFRGERYLERLAGIDAE